LIGRSEYNSTGREVRFSILGSDSTYLSHELVGPSNLLCEQPIFGWGSRRYGFRETG